MIELFLEIYLALFHCVTWYTKILAAINGVKKFTGRFKEGSMKADDTD
jgi:hypothetical protein